MYDTMMIFRPLQTSSIGNHCELSKTNISKFLVKLNECKTDSYVSGEDLVTEVVDSTDSTITVKNAIGVHLSRNFLCCMVSDVE